jgi:glycosyltransferase involved in cell wall biosynthesis
MLIGIDGNEANVENRVGVNEYAWQLLWNIYKLSDEWKDEFQFVIYLKNKPTNLPDETKYWRYKVLPGSGIWIIKSLTPQLLLSKNKPDLFFSPSHYLPPLLTMSSICSIMDVGYLESSEQFKKRDYWQLKYWSAYSMYISKRIIAISNATKKDIVRHYKFTSEKIDVTLLGYNDKTYNIKLNNSNVRRVKNKYSIGDDYILFLGTLKPSKNIEGLIRAWAKIEKDFVNTKLVIAGKKGWLFDSIYKLVGELGIDKRLIFTDFIKVEDKPYLIAGAKLFAIPSFWEGFGIDVLSAMACGVPVLSSKKGSLAEVGGEAAIYIDPYNIDDMAKSMKKVLSMSEKDYNKIVKKGLSQVKKFSWENTALETLKIFRKFR